LAAHLARRVRFKQIDQVRHFVAERVVVHVEVSREDQGLNKDQSDVQYNKRPAAPPASFDAPRGGGFPSRR
jgi:hypothetical protein